MQQSEVTSSNNIIYGGTIEGGLASKAISLGQFCLDCFKGTGDNVIMIDGISEVEITASKFSEIVIDFARNLRALGIKEGDSVGLYCENRFEFAYAMYGTFLLNATLAPFNVTYTERELHHAASLSKPKIVFGSNTTIKKLAKVAQKNSFIKNVVNFDDTTPSRFVMPYSKFLKSLKGKPKGEFKVKPTNVTDNVALILCSSGTTGLPKGVQITQGNILCTSDAQLEQKDLYQWISVLSVIPWFHAYGILTLIMLNTLGARMVFLPKFQEHLFLNAIQHYQIDGALMVPPLMVFLAKHPMIEKYDLSSLKVLLCGAAPLGKETTDAVSKRIGVPLIRQGFGVSEATMGLLIQTFGYETPGSVGTVRPGTYAKIIDPETGKPLGPNERGELCFKGPAIMKGYVGDKKASAQAIDSEGWLHTGDVAYYDEKFEFFIVDRLKELIKYKAYQVPPAELEALLLTNPKIKDAAVIGVPDEASGELPMAFVTKQPNADLTQQEVMEFVAERVSPAKRLHGGVQFIDEIPKNASGKILRRVLRDMVSKNAKSKL